MSRSDLVCSISERFQCTDVCYVLFDAVGYSEEDNDDILNNIIKEYEKDEDSRVTTARDVIAKFKFESNDPNGVVVAIVVGVIVVLGIVIVVKAREE